MRAIESPAAMVTSTKGGLTLGQNVGNAVQHILHHLGFDAQKNIAAFPGNPGIVTDLAAQLCGQGLRLGYCAVGEKYLAGTGSLADGTRHSAAHIAAPDKPVSHGH